MSKMKEQLIRDKTDILYVGHLEAENDILRDQVGLLNDEIDKLRKYRDLVLFIANDYHELSYEKIKWQRDDWKKRCNKLRNELESDEVTEENVWGS